MTDLSHSDDELVSSYIDGEATFDEVARVQADPELLAEIRAFEAVAELLSTPVATLPQSEVDELIGNALDQSGTSDRIIDLSAVRAGRVFTPQRLATIAAGVLLLAGAVGALIAINNSATRDEMSATSADSSEMADDYVGDDGDDGDDGLVFDSDMGDDGDDTAEAMPEDSAMDDMADEYFEDDDDMADSTEETAGYADDSEQGVADDQTEATTTVAAVEVRRSYSPLNLEIAEGYESLDGLIDHTTEQWRELVDGRATPVPEDTEGYEPTEEALSAIPCGHSLLTHMHSIPEIDGADTLRVSETTINGIPITVAVLALTGDHPPDTAALLTAGEPTCTVEQLATLTP